MHEVKRDMVIKMLLLYSQQKKVNKTDQIIDYEFLSALITDLNIWPNIISCIKVTYSGATLAC